MIRNSGAPWALALLGAAAVVSMRTTTEERNLPSIAGSTWISKAHLDHSDGGIDLDAASEYLDVEPYDTGDDSLGGESGAALAKAPTELTIRQTSPLPRQTEEVRRQFANNLFFRRVVP